MGSLKSKAPAGGFLDLAAGATIDEALAALALPAPEVQIVMLNGRPQPDRSRRLSSTDTLTIIPLVGGG